MKVKCDQCDNEATVHEVTRQNGVKFEKHLCEACAAQQGISPQPMPIQQMMTKVTVTKGVGVTIQMGVAVPKQVCPACRLTFQEFKQGGVVGCPECYRAFEEQLGPMIERAHEGGSKHTGKVPRRACKAEKGTTAAGLSLLQERAERLLRIKKQLDDAVAHEQYERAAVLRDELRKLDVRGAGGSEMI